MESRILAEMAEAYGMTVQEYRANLITQCFGGGAASDAQILTLLSVARKYDFNPLVRELHAYVNKKTGRMEIVIGVDGWFKMLSRDRRVAGYKRSEVRDEQGALQSVTYRVYRHDWKLDNGEYLPGEYTARLDEWMVEHQPGKEATNWEEMPEHRLDGVGIKEAVRRTLGITEAMGEADEAKLSRLEEREVVVTPSVAQPKALEHQPLEPMPDLAERREAVPAVAGHVRVKLDEVQIAPTEVGGPPARPFPPIAGTSSQGAPAQPFLLSAQSCRNAGCTKDAVGVFKTKVGEYALCEEHRAQHEVKRRGRPRAADGVVTDVDLRTMDRLAEHEPPEPTSSRLFGRSRKTDGAAAAVEKEVAAAATVNGGGQPEVPEATPSASTSAPVAVPDELPLAAFVRTHDVPQKRIDLALAKYGVSAITELDTEQAAAILDVFRRSYATS